MKKDFLCWMWWYLKRRTDWGGGSEFRSLHAHSGFSETQTRCYLKHMIHLGHVVVKPKTKDDGYRGRLRYYVKGRTPCYAKNA